MQHDRNYLEDNPPLSVDGFTFDLQRFDSAFSGGDGSADNPYEIANVTDLQTLATDVNGGKSYLGKYFQLTANIDLNGVTFTPIGNYVSDERAFNGTFDGGNYTISNLTISGSNDYIGLFGEVGYAGTVKNVTLENVNVSGRWYVGGLVGQNKGKVIDNTVSGTVSGPSEVGGVVGFNSNDTEVSGNSAFITVNATSDNASAGGLVGRNQGTVKDNKFCSNCGAIDDEDDSSNTRLYALTELNGVTAKYTGGSDVTVTFNGTTYYASGATFTLTVTEYPEGKYLKGATFNDDGTFTYTAGSTSVEWADIPTIDGLTFDKSINGFNISTAADLQALATYVNGGGDTTDLNFKVTADIDLSSVSNFTPIGKDYKNTFKGTFDGASFTISNLTINSSSSDYVGLFGYVGTGGTVKNATLNDVNVTGKNYVGGLVGNNKGTVMNCTVSVNGNVSGSNYVGGIVGYNDNGGKVTDSIVDNVSVSATNSSSNVGGFVGYNRGEVSGNTVSNGTVTDTNADGSKGGLVGWNYKGTVSDNTVDAQITVGTGAYVGGVAGRNNAGTVTGNVAVSEITAGNNAKVGNVVGYEEDNSSTIKNNFFSGSANDAIGGNSYNGTNENISDNNRLYVVTLPGGVEATGDTCSTVNGKTYAVGNVTVAAKTGYVYSGDTSVEITADTDLSELGTTTLDTNDNKHYVFGNATDGYTLATADNVATNGYPDLTQVYKLTLQGVTVTGENVFNVDGTTYAIGEVTIAVKTGYIYSDSTSLNVTEDTSITATDVWGGEGGADGSTANPFLISDVAGLQYLAEYVNAGNTCEGLNFKLNGNIDLTDVDFAPIGNFTNQFKGTFDGNNSAGYKISKLTVNTPDKNNVGLFGYVGTGGTIQNVTLTDVNITGKNNVGGLLGDNEGEVTNCTVSGTVSGNSYVGGLVGLNAFGGRVENNTAITTVNGSNSPVGGVAGSNGSVATNNRFYGNQTDALGRDVVSDSKNTRYYKLTVPEDVTASGNSFTFDGTTYAAGTVTLLSAKTGYAFNETSIDVTEDADLSTTTFTATDVWGVESGANGSTDNPYLISSVEGLQLLAAYVNAGNDCAGLNFKLTADIDMSSVENFTAIGNYTNANNYNPFSGTFDGGDFKISNLKINSTLHYNGLFSYVGKDGTVKNVTLDNVDISGNGSLGALVGQNNGTVENCTVSGKVNGTGQFVGGLVGDNRGTVSGGTVNNVEVNSSYRIVGGLVGVNNGGTITDGTVNGGKVTSNGNNVGGLVGYNAGTVTGGTVNNVEVSGYRWVGGLTGYNTGGTVTGSKVVATVTATFTATETVYSFVGGVVGQNANSGTVGTSENPNYYHSDKGAVEGADADNNVPIYELTLPAGVEVSGALLTDDNKAYVTAGTVTFTGVKTGYVIDGVNVTQDTTITASLDTTNHYVLADDTKTLATADNTTDYSDLKQVYALTLPKGVTADGDIVATADGKTYAAGSVTFTGAKTGYVIDGVNVTQDTTITATVDTANHYVLADDTKTLATAANTTDYPNLVQVYELTVPDSLKVTGDTVATANGKTYAAGSVTFTAADGYTVTSITVNGETLDGKTFTVNAATKISVESIKSINGGKGVEVGGTTGDFSENKDVYSITASQENSTLTGNAKNNTVVLTGGGENILTGGSGNDTFKFGAGGGIVKDFGIGATKDGAGKTLSAPSGSDIVKVSGTVSGIYFDRNASSKKSAKFTAVITYDSDDVQGDDTQIIVLQNISKKPTKYGSNPVYQTNDVAAATLKIWDTSGSKQAVLSATKLKALFRDDNDLDDLIQAKVTYLGDIADGNTPTSNPFEQTKTITPNGDDNG